MKKFLVAALLLGFFLILPLASAGYVDVTAEFSGGSFNFNTYHYTEKGSIIQEYTSSGDGSIRFRSSYTTNEVTVDEITADGPGTFTTILDPTPSYSWTANANYLNDGSPVSDSGSGTTLEEFDHTWTSSFTNTGAGPWSYYLI